MFLNCLICSLGQHFTDIKGSKYMLVHSLSCSLGQHCTGFKRSKQAYCLNLSLASKYARFVILERLMYWTPPPPDETIGLPLLKSDDLSLREPRDIGLPLSKILDTPLIRKYVRTIRKYVTSGEKYVTSDKTVRDIRIHECTPHTTRLHCTHKYHVKL